ncbi:UNVERIFIED_CONTAM: hypothetical protein NY603_20445, partial [Bacteroidetes bacterium 56_B9]
DAVSRLKPIVLPLLTYLHLSAANVQLKILSDDSILVDVSCFYVFPANRQVPAFICLTALTPINDCRWLVGLVGKSLAI